MKKLVGTVLFFVVVASCNVFAQRIKVIPHVGVGNYLDRDHAQGRGLIGIEGDVQLISDKLEVGLLLAGGSDFIPTGDPEIRNDLDTVQINPRAHRFNLFSLVQRYHFQPDPRCRHPWRSGIVPLVCRVRQDLRPIFGHRQVWPAQVRQNHLDRFVSYTLRFVVSWYSLFCNFKLFR